MKMAVKRKRSWFTGGGVGVGEGRAHEILPKTVGVLLHTGIFPDVIREFPVRNTVGTVSDVLM